MNKDYTKTRGGGDLSAAASGTRSD